VPSFLTELSITCGVRKQSLKILKLSQLDCPLKLDYYIAALG